MWRPNPPLEVTEARIRSQMKVPEEPARSTFFSQKAELPPADVLQNQQQQQEPEDENETLVPASLAIALIKGLDKVLEEITDCLLPVDSDEWA